MSSFFSKKGLWELTRFIFIVTVIVVPIRFYIAQPFIVRGESMFPTFSDGDYLIIDELTYNFLRDAQRGEVIVFRYPQDPSKFFIKRVIGLPGETILIRDGKVYINGGDKSDTRGAYLNIEETFPDGEWQLGKDEYFVIGDNRKFSSDSRFWGALPEDMIVGRALLRLWPLAEAVYLPGGY